MVLLGWMIGVRITDRVLAVQVRSLQHELNPLPELQYTIIITHTLNTLKYFSLNPMINI